ncbi:hypothetical protein [Crocosphaera sp.]|uniref:hypothetical protein n=1 Tax=Crocosphaera sp. TaxID=2729996 RepID=UPI003F24F4ED|nr:hypothetical protein [Crocosphaera sp.]
MNSLKSIIFVGLLSISLPSDFPSFALETNPIINSVEIAQNRDPETYVKVQDINSLVMQITEGEYRFRGILKRIGSKEFIGNDRQSRVVFNPYNGHIMVFSVATGAEFYNYYIDPVSGVGENPDTMCDPETEPC